MRLQWDKTGERKYETGTENGVLYTQKSDGTYNNGVVWNGLTGATDSPEGAEANDLYADNIKYASLRSAETFKGTIEAFMYPPEFGECDGTVSPVKGVYIGQQKRKPFGFVYKSLIGNDTASDEDDGYKLHIWYNCTASPSEKAYETVNESPNAITFSWSVDTTPVPILGTKLKPCATITIDSTEFTTQEEKAHLAALEDLLFGTDGTGGNEGTNATLPDPATVLSTLGYTAPSGN